MRLEHVVHRIATDSEFAASVAEDPAAALHRADIDLRKGESQALLAALRARTGQKNGPNGRTWFETRLGRDLGRDQLQGRTWFETRLARDLGSDQLQGRTWFEEQMEADPT